MRLLLLQTIDRHAHPLVSGSGLNKVTPAFNHHLKRLKCAARNNRCRYHHATSYTAMECQISAAAENDDLCHEPSKFRCSADPKIAIQCTALEDQCAGLITTPVQNALVEHAHGINYLGITRQRLGLRIRFRGMKIGFSQKRVCGLLIDHRNRNQYQAGYKANEAQDG